MVGITQVGIGTTTPNNKAALDVQSSNKGILFPRLTTTQRDAIVDPPDGLHIYNLQERCLNYYDSTFRIWNCYCDSDSCRTIMIRIMPGCSVDFQALYASKYPTVRKFVLLVQAGDTICSNGPLALNFQTLPADFFNIRLVNRGVIIGSGGTGGSGSAGQPGSCYKSATPGIAGGSAIGTKIGITLKVENFGLIAAGGGGGGGGGGTTTGQYGGGGGGGIGYGAGGQGGGNTTSLFGCGIISNIAQNGNAGTGTTPGAGGTGVNGGNGGQGGLLAQSGQSGTGANAGAGGPPGKAHSGPAGAATVINFAGGQVLGVVD